MRYKMWLPSLVVISVSLASALMPKIYLTGAQDDTLGSLVSGDTLPYPAQTIDMPVSLMYPSPYFL
jgi:hypothetical protein